MTSIDDLLRKPLNHPVSHKRKLDDPTFTASYRSQPNKSARLAHDTSPRSVWVNGHSGSKSKPAGVSEEEKRGSLGENLEEGSADEDEDTEAGPLVPPEDGIEEEEAGDDAEGRFFGGGVTRREKQALDYLDTTTTEEEVYDSVWLRRACVGLQKKIDRNAELRARFADDPKRFVSSEADLDEEIKGLSILSDHGELYQVFVAEGQGGIQSLVGLLGHENTDVAVRAVEVLGELTGDDTGVEEGQWEVLTHAMVETGVVELAVSNLGRLDEDGEESDRDGVYRVLELLENLCHDPRLVDRMGSQKGLLRWLLVRVQKPDAGSRGMVGQNRQYAAEVLAILLQGDPKTRSAFVAMDGVDVLLQLLSKWRKHDPEKDSDEEEFVENLFDCLTCLMEDRAGGEKFVDGEGVELCLIMLREGKMSRTRALKVLDHAASGQNAVAVCERLVQAEGLKTVFGKFMKKQKVAEREPLEHLLGVFASLLRYLPGESAPRVRTLAKFVEKDYEKIVRIVDVKREYTARLGRTDREIEDEKKVIDPDEYEVMEAEWYSRRLDAGLFHLQTLDVVLSWLVAEDDGARNKITALLGGLDPLVQSLQEQIKGIDVDSRDTSGREMLEALLRCVQAS